MGDDDETIAPVGGEVRPVRFFVLSLAVAASGIWLAWWAAPDADGFLMVPLYLAVALLLFSVVWTCFVVLQAEPAVRGAVTAAGIAAVGGWFLLATALLILAVVAYFAALYDNSSVAVWAARAGLVVSVIAGVLNGWLCSRAVARRMRADLPTFVVVLVLAVCGGLSAGLPLGLPAYRRWREAEEAKTDRCSSAVSNMARALMERALPRAKTLWVILHRRSGTPVAYHDEILYDARVAYELDDRTQEIVLPFGCTTAGLISPSVVEVVMADSRAGISGSGDAHEGTRLPPEKVLKKSRTPPCCVLNKLAIDVGSMPGIGT